MRHPFFFIGLLLLNLFCSQIFPKNKKNKTPDLPKQAASYKAPVNVVIVKASVTDKAGNPVTDLSLNDFKVYDDGILQSIQTFALEMIENPEIIEQEKMKIPGDVSKGIAYEKVPAKARMISIIIDDLTMASVAEFPRVIDAAKEFIRKYAGVSDQVALLAGSRKVQLPFSDDKQHLIEELDAVPKKLNFQTTQRFIPDMTDFEAYNIATLGFQSMYYFKLIQSLSGKSSSSEDEAPKFAKSIDEETILNTALMTNDDNASRTQRLLYTIQQHIRTLKHFEGAKIIVLFSDGFLSQKGTPAAYQLQEIVNTALRSDIIINTVSIRGITSYSSSTADIMLDTSEDRVKYDIFVPDRQWKISMREDDKVVQHLSLDRMAKETGGQFFHDNSMIQPLQTIAGRKANYYVMTYGMPPHKADGAYHNIKLEVNRPGIELSYRKGYYILKEELTFENTKKEDIIDALNSAGNMNEIPISLAYNYFKENPSSYVVSFITSIDIHNVQFPEESGRRINQISLILAAFDEKDVYINGLEKALDFQLLENNYSGLCDKGLKSRVEFKLPAGSYKIKAVIREGHQGKMGSITKTIVLKQRDDSIGQRPADGSLSEKQENILMAALTSSNDETKLPIIIRPLFFNDTGGKTRVLVAARINVEKAVFKKVQGQPRTDLHVLGAAYSQEGNIAALFKETFPVQYEKESELRQKPLVYQNYLRLIPGKYRFKLAVSDPSGNLGTIEQTLEVPAFQEKGMAGSSIVLAGQVSQLPDSIQNIQAQLLDENNPLHFSGIQVEPNIENKWPASAPIPIMFRLYNLPESPNGWNFSVKAKLRNKTGNEYILKPVIIEKAISPTGKTEAVGGIGLLFDAAIPGRYELIVNIREVFSSETAALQTNLELTSAPGKNNAAASREEKTIIDMDIDELRRNYPLQPKDMTLSQNQKEIGYLLQKVGDNVREFFHNFADTSSKEQILLQNFGVSRLVDSTTRFYNYLIQYSPDEKLLHLNEYRTDDKFRPVDAKVIDKFYLTLGYSCLSVIFHPEYQKNSRFRYIGKLNSGSRAHVLVFEQNLRSGGYAYIYKNVDTGAATPLPLQGMVWLDPDTYQILRMRTNLIGKENQSIVERQTTDIQFSEVFFEKNQQKIWLPREVLVDMIIAGKNYRNYHRYTDYQLFRVNSDFQIAKPKQKPN
jgi:VWFA-related protein